MKPGEVRWPGRSWSPPCASPTRSTHEGSMIPKS